MDELQSNLVKGKYSSILVDGSTHKVVVEQEAIYFIYILLLHVGVPKLRYVFQRVQMDYGKACNYF